MSPSRWWQPSGPSLLASGRLALPLTLRLAGLRRCQTGQGGLPCHPLSGRPGSSVSSAGAGSHRRCSQPLGLPSCPLGPPQLSHTLAGWPGPQGPPLHSLPEPHCSLEDTPRLPEPQCRGLQSESSVPLVFCARMNS